LANFENGELWGRASDVPWAMVFPRDPDQIPRHPSQLYEAFLEGVVLFVLLWVIARREEARKRYGLVFGVFIAGYGLARFVAEFAREPDAFLGYQFAGATMGQLLSLPMFIIGLFFIARSRQCRTPTPS
ncbi:MAG: prolipoprotein diacylglyceryl transferase, partial [Alphaproteobacteria bacterium]